MIAPRPRVIRARPQINPASPQKNGLVGAWPLNDGVGLVARDAWQANNGTLTNGPTWSKWRYGGALTFDGVNDYVAIADAPQYDKTAMSVSANVVVITRKESGIVTKGLHASNVCEYFLCISAAGKLSFGLESDGIWGPEAFVAQSDQVPLLTPMHVVGTYDGATIKFYVNGVLAEAKSASIASFNSNGSLLFGVFYDMGSLYSFNGLIYDVRIYNRALSDADVKQIYWRPWDLYATPRSLLYAATIEEAYNIWLSGQRAQQGWSSGHRAQQIWTGGHRII